mmetsp:Transcript_27155/g.54642  ORF Transcript_27155/g.54642 Transcript_27155/m.54642 type:complete len:85 (-) Transcript_27155:800-1054(-)
MIMSESSCLQQQSKAVHFLATIPSMSPVEFRREKQHHISMKPPVVSNFLPPYLTMENSPENLPVFMGVFYFQKDLIILLQYHML